MNRKIRYRKGYKYQIGEMHEHYWPDLPDFSHDWFACKDEILRIREGYAWNGPSGPTFDTPCFMRGSLIHDTVYQAMREKLLDLAWKIPADKRLYKICRQDGMWLPWAKMVRWAVINYAPKDGGTPRPIITAP